MLQTAILEDIGRGSIFENIQKINHKMELKLRIKVDLSKANQKSDGAIQEAATSVVTKMAKMLLTKTSDQVHYA